MSELKKRNPSLRSVANRIANAVFTNGSGKSTARLVHIDKDGHDLGGWSVLPLRDHILRVLREQFRSSK